MKQDSAHWPQVSCYTRNIDAILTRLFLWREASATVACASLAPEHLNALVFLNANSNLLNN